MFDLIKNKTVFANKYHTHSEAMIVSCFFNPQNSPYRIKAFKMWYESIKHLNHSIIECVIGDAQPQLEESENIKRVYTENLLWHKEALLNKVSAPIAGNSGVFVISVSNLGAIAAPGDLAAFKEQYQGRLSNTILNSVLALKKTAKIQDNRAKLY